MSDSMSHFEKAVDALDAEVFSGDSLEDDANALLMAQYLARWQRRMAESVSEKKKEIVAELSLANALWWFIENVTEDDPARQDLFFELRKRVRTGK